MKPTEVDEFHGIGGAYHVGRDGKRKRVEEPTKDHPEGNAPRNKDGSLIVFAKPDGESAKSAAPDVGVAETVAVDESHQAPKGADKKGGSK